MQSKEVAASKRLNGIVAAIFAALGVGGVLWSVFGRGGSVTDPVSFAMALTLWGAVCAMVGFALVELVAILRRPRTLAAVLFVIAGLLLVVRGEIWYWHYTTSPAYVARKQARRLTNWQPSGDTFRAALEAKETIKVFLKCPSTAQVEAHAEHRGGGRYLVSGHADAQNSFGAMKRVYFTCTVVESPRGWTTQDLDYAEP